jgi:hypothetical protein
MLVAIVSALDVRQVGRHIAILTTGVGNFATKEPTLFRRED